MNEEKNLAALIDLSSITFNSKRVSSFTNAELVDEYILMKVRKDYFMSLNQEVVELLNIDPKIDGKTPDQWILVFDMVFDKRVKERKAEIEKELEELEETKESIIAKKKEELERFNKVKAIN